MERNAESLVVCSINAGCDTMASAILDDGAGLGGDPMTLSRCPSLELLPASAPVHEMEVPLLVANGRHGSVEHALPFGVKTVPLTIGGKKPCYDEDW